MCTTKLITKEELGRRHPALVRKKYTLAWLIRSRQIPFIKLGRNVFFDEAAVDKWIQFHTVKPETRGVGDVGV